MKKDYSHSISMQCSTCGGSDFKFEDESGPYDCIICGRTYSREDIIRENESLISDNTKIMKDEITKDIRNDFKKMFDKFK